MNYRVIVASVLLVSAAPLLAEQPPLKEPGHWAQDYTGRKADPLVRFGCRKEYTDRVIEGPAGPADLLVVSDGGVR